MNGWIKLHRKLLEKAIWRTSTPEQKNILITILLLANHEETEWEWQGKKFIIKPGQFITSLPKLAEEAGVTVQNVRTALKKFLSYKFLTDQSTDTGRLITIENWAFYQCTEDTTNSLSNRPLTDCQQTPNRPLTANKNDKNIKNDKTIYKNIMRGAGSSTQVEAIKSTNSDNQEPPEMPTEIRQVGQVTVISLPLNDKTEYEVTREQCQEWADLYPAVDVIQQLRSMRGWLLANPTKAKTRRGILRFITLWLQKTQDKGGNNIYTAKETLGERNRRITREFWEQEQAAEQAKEGGYENDERIFIDDTKCYVTELQQAERPESNALMERPIFSSG